MKTDTCLMMITNPCYSAVLDYKVHNSNESTVFSLQDILELLLPSMRNKVSWNDVRSNFVYIYFYKAGSSLCFGKLQGHNGHPCYCCLSIHFCNRYYAKEQAPWWLPHISQGIKLTHGKIHDSLYCFSTLLLIKSIWMLKSAGSRLNNYWKRSHI